MSPNVLLRWSMEPVDCTSLRRVEACALHKAKTDEWLSGIQVEASGVGVGGLRIQPVLCPVFCDCVLCECWAILLWALCWVWGSSKDRVAGESDQPQQKPRRIILHKKRYPGQVFGQSSSLHERGWDSVESDGPGSLSYQTNV